MLQRQTSLVVFFKNTGKNIREIPLAIAFYSFSLYYEGDKEVKMRCPRCSSLEDKVLESRQNASGSAIRRRRECLSCGYRSTSYERIEDKPVMVIKRDGRREMFDISKVGRGIRSCTEKLSISEHQIETLLQNIEDAIMLKLGNRREISSTEIGEEALRQLKTVDLVAYVRFAAVYKAFNDIEQFIGEIKQLDKELN